MPSEEMSQIRHLFFEYEGKFHQHIRKAKKALDLKAFESLSNMTEKVQFIKKSEFNLKPKVDLIKVDLETALKFKDEGNKLFKAGQLMEAKDLYTKALMYCPFNMEEPEKNKEYSIILANRSACLDTVGLYEAALQDIELALKCGYPKELKFKIYNRQGHSLFARKQFKDSQKVFNLCCDFIGKSDMKTQERERWRIKMAKQKSVFNSAKKGVHNQPLPERPWAQQAEKEPCLALDEKDVKTTKDVNVEEIVHTEIPFASVILDGKLVKIS